MTRFVLRRLASVVGVLAVLSFGIFSLATAIPGDIATVIVGTEGATDEQFAALRERYGLDGSFLERYVDWVTGVLRLDFGTSPITGRSVSSDLAQQIPVSLELAVLGLLISTLIGVPLGVLAARHAHGGIDVGMRVGLLVVSSLPSFVLGILVVLYGSRYLPALYTSRYTPLTVDVVENLRSMAFPVLVISIPLAAIAMQMTRAAMIEQMSSDYVRLARAKGVGESRVFLLHALKNALPPLVTMLGYQFGLLLGGLFVVEQIFSLPGLGRGLLGAIGERDYPFVAAATMVLAAAFVIGNTIVDLVQPSLDPRLRDSQ